MVDVSSQNNSVSINVSTGGNSANINATPDMAQYYSEKSREWAISNRIVDGVDYSSKYYANKADQSALSAKNYAQSAENSYNQFQGSVDSAIGNINSSAQTAINAIDLKGEEAKETIGTVAQGAVAGIKQESQIQMSTIQQVSQLEQEEIQEIINRIDDGKAVYIGENEPTDPVYSVWVDTNDDEVTLDVEEIAADIKKISGKVTNCITEIPQRIEVILNDEYLALKEGSDIVIPYGTEDLTEQFPIGSKFLVDSCTVVDTSYAGGKFFVIAKYGSHYNIPIASSGTTTTKMFFVVGARPEGNAWSHRTSAKALAISGTTAPTGNGFFYNTTENTIRYYNQGTMETPYYGFPVALVSVVQGKYEAIDQVFNGMGEIGSCWWVDKGVKYIVANGRNADGTLKNIEAETDHVLTAFDSIGSSTPEERIGFLGININNGKPALSFRLAQNCFEQSTMPTSLNKYTGFAGYWYNPETNKQYVCAGSTGTPSWLDSNIGVPIIKYDLTTGSSLLNVGDFRKPFRAVDYNDLMQGNGIKTVVETYVNGTSWYRVWSDGWCEQGALFTVTASSHVINLLKPYINTNYSISITSGDNSNDTGGFTGGNGLVIPIEKNSFKVSSSTDWDMLYWETRGYIS